PSAPLWRRARRRAAPRARPHRGDRAPGALADPPRARPPRRRRRAARAPLHPAVDRRRERHRRGDEAARSRPHGRRGHAPGEPLMTEARPSWVVVQGQVPCSACGAALDPLRAGHVAIFNAQLCFFCDYGRCRQRFLGQAELASERPEPLEPERKAELDAVIPPVRAAAASAPDEAVPERLELDEDALLAEPIAAPVQAEALPDELPERREM